MIDRKGRALPWPVAGATCLLVVAALGFPAAGWAQSSGEKTTATSPESLLFVQTASKGRLYRNDAGKLTLGLSASRWTQTFTDRPQRKADVEKTSGFIRKWRSRGFRADPPNAALSIDRPGGDVISLELRRPRLARGELRYSVKRLEGGAGKVRLGRFGTASLFIDNASTKWCFNEFGPMPCAASTNKMILILQLPPYTGAVNVTLSGGSANFSSTQWGSGLFSVNVNGPNSLTVGGCACADFVAYQPILVQGGGGEYQVTTSVPVQVAPDNYSYVPVGPNNPVTYSFGN
jgi:hypothetical protein